MLFYIRPVKQVGGAHAGVGRGLDGSCFIRERFLDVYHPVCIFFSKPSSL